MTANASISLEGTGLRTTTGANGGSESCGVPPGTYTLRARLIGFQAAGQLVKALVRAERLTF